MYDNGLRHKCCFKSLQKCFRHAKVYINRQNDVYGDNCGTPEGIFTFRYLSEKKLKQGSYEGVSKSFEPQAFSPFR